LSLPDVPSAAPAVAASALTDTAEVVREQRWRELERVNLLRALTKADFRLSGRGGAADLLGINAATLASRLKRFGIRPRDLKQASRT